MASIDLAPVGNLTLLRQSGEGSSSHRIHVLPLLPSEGFSAASAVPALRCVRAKIGRAPEYGVWTEGKGFERVKALDPKCASGVGGACTDGSATGLFLTREGGSRGVGFTYVEHERNAPTRLSTKPLTFSEEITTVLAQGDVPSSLWPTSSVPVVTACVLRRDTPHGPMVACLLSVCNEQQEQSPLILLVGALRTGRWHATSAGAYRQGATPALFLRPHGESVVLLDSTVSPVKMGQTTPPRPTTSLAEAARCFHLVEGSAAEETIVAGQAARTTAAAAAGTSHTACVTLRERTLFVRPDESPTLHSLRLFRSGAFHTEEPVPPEGTLCDVDLGGSSTATSVAPIFTIGLPSFVSASADEELLYVTPNATLTSFLGSYHRIPSTLAPVASAVAALPPDNAQLLPDRPRGACVAFFFSPRASNCLYAAEVWRNGPLGQSEGGTNGVPVTIGANASAGFLSNQVTLRESSGMGVKGASSLKLGKWFGKGKSTGTTAAPDSVSPATDGAFAASRQLLVMHADSGVVYLLVANGTSASILRMSQCVLGSYEGTGQEKEEGLEALTRDPRASPVANGEELGDALSELAKVSHASSLRERKEATERALRRVLPTLQYVGAAQKDVYLIQRVFCALLEAHQPTSYEEWQYVWASVTRMQDALSRRTHTTGELVFTDFFFLELARQYVDGHASSSDEAERLRGILESLPHVVSDEMKDLVSITAAAPPEQPATTFVLEALASRTSLLPLAEEVIRRFVETSTMANGTCTVRPRRGAASCVHAVGTLLLASCLDLVVSVVQDSAGTLSCYCDIGDRLAGEVKKPRAHLQVPVQPFRTQAEFHRALVLAADMLCVPQEPMKAGAAEEGGHAQSQYLILPMLALAVSRRVHCLSAFFQLHAPLLQDAIAQSSGAPQTTLSDNTTWIQAAVHALSRPYEEEVRQALLPAVAGTDPVTVVEALAYVLTSGGRSLNRTLLRAANAALPGEVCACSVVLLLFSVGERLVGAQNNFCAAAAKTTLATRANAKEEAEEALQECRRRLATAMNRALRVWGEALSQLPYKLPDMLASYAAEVAASLQRRGGHEPLTAPPSGTVISRMLIQSLRLLTLTYYTQQLVLRMDRAKELCDKAAATGDELSEFHPAIDGSLQALFILNALRQDCIPLDWLRGKLLGMIETVLPRLTQPRSAPWAPFFVHVLELSSMVDTGLASLKKRYFTLLDTLRNTELFLAEEDAVRTATHTYMSKADRLARALSIQDEFIDGTPPSSGHAKLSRQTLFVLSHTADATLPAWVHSHSLASRQFLVDTEWTDRLWAMERMQEPFREATEAISARLLKEREYVEKQLPLAGSSSEESSLSSQLQRPLFSALCEVAPPLRSHSVVTRSTSPAPGLDSASVPTRSPPVAPRTSLNLAQRTAPDEASTPNHADTQRVPNAPAHTQQRTGSVTNATPGGTTDAIEAKEATQRGAEDCGVNGTLASPPLPHDKGTHALTADKVPAAMEAASNGHAGLYSAKDVAWWETSTPSPARDGAHGQDTSQGSRGEQGALSDTDTSYTTATSRSTVAGAEPAAEAPDRHKTPGSSRCVLHHNPAQHDVHVGGAVERKRGHCRCRHLHKKCSHHSHRHRHTSADAWGCRGRALDAPASPFLLSADGLPAANVTSAHDPSVRALAHTERLQLLQLSRAALSPGTTCVRTKEEGRPATSQGRTTTPASQQSPAAMDSNGQVALLSLGNGGGHGGGRQRVHVQLFGASPENENAAVPLQPRDELPLREADASPFLRSATAKMSVRYLEPPPLPAASVFTAPPPLLHLSLPRTEKAPPLSTAAGYQGQQDADTTFAPPAPPAPPAPLAPQSTPAAPGAQAPQPPGFPSPAEVHPYAQVPREHEPPTTLPLHNQRSETRPTPVPLLPTESTSATVRAPELKQPILSPSELTDFRRYTDELKSKGTAAFLPVPVAASSLPCASTVSPSLGAVPASQTQGIPSSAGGPSYVSLLEQHNTFLQRVESVLHKHDSENEQFHARLLDAVQRSNLSAPLARPPGNGLSAVEQAKLVQNTIQQRNDLMNLNQQLLDLQLHAARASTGVVKQDTTAAPQLPPALSAGPASSQPSFMTTSSTALPVPSSWPPNQASGPHAVATGTHTLPPPVPRVATTTTTTSNSAAQTSPVAVRDAAVETDVSPHANAPAPPVDERATKSVEASMADLNRLNAELLSMNASAGAMERAIAETREAIGRYEACRSMDAANAEGAALLASLRHRTEAAERRLAEVTAAAKQGTASASSTAPGKPLVTPWSALKQSTTPIVTPTARPPLSSQEQPLQPPPQQAEEASHQSSWLGQSRRAEWESEGAAVPVPQANAPAPASTQQIARKSSAPALRPPPPPPVQPQTHHSGPLSLQTEPSTPARVFRGTRSPTHANSSHFSSSTPPIPTWDPTRQAPQQPLSAVRPLQPREPHGAAPPAAGGASVTTPSTTGSTSQPTDLGTLYASTRHPAGSKSASRRTSPSTSLRPPQRSTSAATTTHGGRFSAYAPASTVAPKAAPTRTRQRSQAAGPQAPRTVSPEPQRPSLSASARPPTATASGTRPPTLAHSTSQRFEARQHSRREESMAQRFAQLEAELFG